MDLGPGLLGGVFDGILRPLRSAGAWIEAGSTRRTPTERDPVWTFAPSARSGEQLPEGAAFGSVVESSAITHHLMVPPGAGGTVDWVAAAGAVRGDEIVARVGGRELGLTQRWPVRRSRPARARLAQAGPLLTGQRVLDLLFPIARAVGVHEVHYAMIIILSMGIGLFAPPFGVGYYGACAIGRVSPDDALWRIWP